MPCSDGGYYRYLEKKEAKERLDSAARAACEAMRILEGMGRLSSVSVFSRDWWEQHKKEDAVRDAGGGQNVS